MGSHDSFIDLPKAYVITDRFFFLPFSYIYLLVLLHILPLNCNN